MLNPQGGKNCKDLKLKTENLRQSEFHDYFLIKLKGKFAP